MKGSSSPDRQRTQSIPLPRGINFRVALVAEGYCQEVGFDSPANGKFCRFKALLDKSEYLAAESTVYRVLRHYKANARRDGGRESVATGTNQRVTKRSDLIKSGRGMLRICETQSTAHALLLRLYGD